MTRPGAVTVTLNPAIDQTLSIPGFAAGRENRVAESWSHAGGKGVNVACVLADLGVAVTVTGFLGAGNAEPFEAAFARKGITDRFVRIPGGTRLGIKIVDDVTGQTTDINFPGLAPRTEDLEQLFERIDALAGPDGWIVLSGSVPAGVADGVYAAMIELIHGRGGRVLLDTSGRPLREGLARAPEVMKPNIEELGELVGQALATPADVRAAAESLLARGVRLVVVSMGSDGALLMNRERSLLARPPRVPVRSTAGAGDAMVAGIVYGMIHGLPLEDLARMATAGGAHAVTRIGPGIEDRSVYRKLIEQVEIEPLP